MNIAFYVNEISTDEQGKEIFSFLNKAVKSESISDASLFFNNPGPSPEQSHFGLFNSTELWTYTGLLINTNLQSAIYSLGVVNKFKPVYLFRKRERDIPTFIFLSNKMPIIVTNKEDEQEAFRVTGKRPKLVDLTVESLQEFYNE